MDGLFGLVIQGVRVDCVTGMVNMVTPSRRKCHRHRDSISREWSGAERSGTFSVRVWGKGVLR